jgi:hypothetical protein
VSHPDSVSRYDLGALSRLVATFVSTDGVTTADPSSIDLLVKNPLGSVSTYSFGVAGASVVRVATGAYVRDTTLDVVGSWFYRWAGTGGVQAPDEYSLLVDRSFIL